MDVQDIAIDKVTVGEANTRTASLVEGEDPDTSIQDLANSLRDDGLLNPITVRRRADGQFECIAGQRRLAAASLLGWATIPAQVRADTDVSGPEGSNGMVLSLVENLHRADMNPRDKARAFGALVEAAGGDVTAAARRAHVAADTVRKYVALNQLSPEIQQRLAAGEIRQTGTLASLAQKFGGDYSKQRAVLSQIEGFNTQQQAQILKRLDPELSNLDELRTSAVEGEFDLTMVQACPRDCPVIPRKLKAEVRDFLIDHGVSAQA